jgi:hypothetical protein
MSLRSKTAKEEEETLIGDYMSLIYIYISIFFNIILL